MDQENEPQIWTPELFGKQIDVFNCRKKILLVSGSRLSGKSWSVQHRVIRHLWETPGARIGVFAKSIKLAKEGGTWQDFLEITVPEWLEANLETLSGKDVFRYTTHDSNGVPGAKQDSSTRSMYFRVRNMYDGESELRLFSIEHDHEVAEKVKNKRFSMIYFIELSMFKMRRVLTITLPSLRMPHLIPQNGKPDIYHQWIADTNPDEDEGDQSWFYKLFWEDRLNVHKKQRTPDQDAFYNEMEVIEMFIRDNPHVTKQQIIELEVSCEGDQALFDSYVLGVHGSASRKKKKHFASVFNKEVHVIGGGPGEGDQIDVSPLSTALFTGWDLGKVNHAAAIMDKAIKLVNGNELTYWSILDEKIEIQEKLTIADFTLDFLSKMEELEKLYKKRFNWIHWSDDSIMNVWNPSSGTFDYMEVQAASRGKIILQGVVKPDGSVEARVRLIKKLLTEQRLFISSRCVKTIQMLEHLKEGETKKEYVVWDENKHIFDAISYVIFMESLEELDRLSRRPEASETKSPLVSIG